MNHPITPLASAEVNHDTLSIELIDPADLPAAVRINWPAKPTVTGARSFPETAAAIVRLFSEAATTLAAIRVRKKL
jgi:hypothetical protein